LAISEASVGRKSRVGSIPSLYFFAYLEAERLLGWSEAMYRLLDPWLTLSMVLVVSLIRFAVRWIVRLFDDFDSQDR